MSDFLSELAVRQNLTSYSQGTIYRTDSNGFRTDEVLMAYEYRYRGNDFHGEAQRLIDELTKSLNAPGSRT